MKPLYLSSMFTLIAAIGLTGCGGGSSAVPSSPPVTTTPTTVTPSVPTTVTPTTPPSTSAITLADLPAAPSGSVTIGGQMTFDLVPLNTVTNGLNFDAITQEPVRGATVEAVNDAGGVIATAATDDNGNYTLFVPSGTPVSIRVLSEIVQTGAPGFDVAVVDNTDGNAVYAAQGTLATSGTTNAIRSLNAASGWDGTSYSGTRVAGPFAILDAVYETVTGFTAVAPDLILPPIEMGWSPNNRPVDGDPDEGEISTSSYVGNGTTGMIFILGAEDADTDEYDRHVIVHEWGHYFEDLVSRADSTGGPHSLGLRLDARLALSEGFGNALSGIILDDSVYRDSSGDQQSGGFGFDVENNNNFNPGWFSEGSTQSIIYDIYDSDVDGQDNIALGLGPIYDALVSPDYINQSTLTTIYSLVEQIRVEAPGSVAGIDAIVTEQLIAGTGFDGAGETNSGGIPTSIPLYNQLVPDGSSVEVCSVDDAGTFNRLGNRAYVRFDIPSFDSYTISAVRSSGALNRDPDFNLFRGNQFLGSSQSGTPNLETSTVNLPADEYTLEVLDFLNIDDFFSDNPDANNGDVCFNVSVQSN